MEAGRQACCTHSQELTGTVLTAILPSMPRGISTVQRPRVEAALSVLEVVALSLGFHLTRMEAGPRTRSIASLGPTAQLLWMALFSTALEIFIAPPAEAVGAATALPLVV